MRVLVTIFLIGWRYVIITITTRIFQIKNCGLRDTLQLAPKVGFRLFELLNDSSLMSVQVEHEL